MPYSSPVKIDYHADGSIKSVNFQKNMPTTNDFNDLKYKAGDDRVVIQCDHLITAFGSQLSPKFLDGFINKKTGLVNINSAD